MSSTDRPSVSDPPPKMSERTLRNTLESIESKCDANGVAIGALQKLEDERAGAAKLRTRLFAVFGSFITAGAIGGFAWVWDAQTSNALQDAAIEEIERRAHEHDPPPPGHNELDERERATERRVDGVERATKTIEGRLDRMEREAASRHTDVLEELRRLRASRRRPPTWGGGGN